MLRMTLSYGVGEGKGVGSGDTTSNPLPLILNVFVILSETKCSEESFNSGYHFR